MKNWIPFKLINQNSEFLFQWLNVGNQPFTDPFFDDTIAKCKRLAENSKTFKCVSEINVITEWAKEIDSVVPSAFIFHVSRCGSTLVSQLLAIKEENISLSEVPVFDEILRMPFKDQVDPKTADDLLPAAFTFYGQKRSGKENRLFIKMDSWHLLFYKQLGALYPHVPFIILYRHPYEVLLSQQRQKGMHAVPGLIEPSVFGFDEKVLNAVHYDDYMSLVLQKYYQTIIEVATQDGRILLINYNEGVSDIMESIARVVGMELGEFDKKKFSERSKFHAKNNALVFTEQSETKTINHPNIEVLERLYSQVEMLRLQV